MVLEMKDLCVDFTGMRGKVQALRNVSLSIDKGEILGVVGESGSGKSVTALSILGLLGSNAHISNGEISYLGQNLMRLGKKEMQSLRGKKIGMVFQEPMTALHPTMKVGNQLAEVMKRHRGVSKKEAYRLAVQALRDVHIHDPEFVAKKYPFELSGGMRQRIVIALAMSAPPDLLIADEPTTALDVTIQQEILQLIKELNAKRGTSVLLITHDLGVVSKVCDRVMVMYAGEVVEEGKTEEVLNAPSHPYTEALLHALPDLANPGQPLKAIPGEVPDLQNRPAGCAFASRCSKAIDICGVSAPALEPVSDNRSAACWLRGTSH
ncbi:ABC transporter ATP-binding protein [Fictibacillus sp. KIGAM418]|uniref:ABC transporter ATP-binding protein n=1 Tax=Fictibacillus marinisediminis TaxID=2878389 RepID=A0A9X1XDT0_9BACL|nr:ABC transporter ATP-binding protein [Fictibacillus marinisediminis]MCK6258934.1 ABC transporter ATP-binding protein [Fictibacillus marinisediminis]